MDEENLDRKDDTEDLENQNQNENDDDLESDGDDEPQTEEWMKTDDDESDQTGTDVVPLHAHIKAKRKLKGRISERDDEIQRLKEENERLKAHNQKPVELPKRPRRDDFDSDEDYEKAFDEYEEKKDQAKFQQFQRTQSIESSQRKAAERIETAVNSHYDRAEKLLESSGISEEAFRAADQSVREAVDAIRPKQGDLIVDQFIARLGEGSEKVIFRLGRSKALRGEFIALLADDPSGLDAATFLGQQKAILLNTKTRLSGAPPPDTQINGDQGAGQKGKALKKRYQDAHKKGEGQAAWNAKKEAKSQGIDTSDW